MISGKNTFDMQNEKLGIKKKICCNKDQLD